MIPEKVVLPLFWDLYSSCLGGRVSHPQKFASGPADPSPVVSPEKRPARADAASGLVVDMVPKRKDVANPAAAPLAKHGKPGHGGARAGTGPKPKPVNTPGADAADAPKRKQLDIFKIPIPLPHTTYQYHCSVFKF